MDGGDKDYEESETERSDEPCLEVLCYQCEYHYFVMGK